MNNSHIDFNSLEWEQPVPGIQQKIFSDGSNRLRQVRFYEDFIEEDWCEKGHTGYVLNGEMTIDFNGSLIHYKKGDGIWITEGEASKHKVIIEKGKQVELILFEKEA